MTKLKFKWFDKLTTLSQVEGQISKYNESNPKGSWIITMVLALFKRDTDKHG